MDAVEYLREALASRRLFLFTGAGFSRGARDRDGRPIPSTHQLTGELWRLCFGDARPDGSSLADLYHHALVSRRARLRALLQRRLRVDPSSLSWRHRAWLSLPWRRVYTLNVDDLERAAARRFALDIATVSALRRRARLHASPRRLDVVHLNGVVDDAPDGVTFSTIQYGERLARRERFYARLVEELRRHPFLFVGTQLGEAPLWQHVEMRALRSTRRRPPSFLVASRLGRARQALLRALGIEWLPMTAERFAADVLPELARRCA